LAAAQIGTHVNKGGFLAMHRKTLKLASLWACVAVVTICSACGLYFSGFSLFMPSGTSMLDTNLIGTWTLVSATLDGRIIVCPANDPVTGFLCGASDTLTLQSDGTFLETGTSTAANPGLWFATNGRVLLEDGNAPGNPTAFTYVISGIELTIATESGAVAFQYERQGAASTVTQQSIVQADPNLNAANLVDPNLVGSWQFVSIEDSGTIVTCPGTSAVPPISCFASETITFSAGNTWVDSVLGTDPVVLSQGIWYIRDARILLDDQVFADNDPVAGTYTIQGDLLTIRELDGQFIVTARRVQN
jgi:hypothetical protein